jgi:hypothetical protein
VRRGTLAVREVRGVSLDNLGNAEKVRAGVRGLPRPAGCSGMRRVPEKGEVLRYLGPGAASTHSLPFCGLDSDARLNFFVKV